MKNNRNINKLSLSLNLVLGVVIGYFCFTRLTSCGPVTPAKPDCNSICEDYSKALPYNFIHRGLLLQMSHAYQETRNLQNALCHENPLYPCDDAGSVWFSLDDLKRFIWEIESRFGKCKCPNNPDDLGVRIYYARYPEMTPSDIKTWSPFLDEIPKDYRLMHTVFMIPTFDTIIDNETAHYDFDIKISNGCFKDTTMNDSIMALMPTGKNHGFLCPPVCKGTEFGQ